MDLSVLSSLLSPFRELESKQTYALVRHGLRRVHTYPMNVGLRGRIGLNDVPVTPRSPSSGAWSDVPQGRGHRAS